MRGYDNFLSQMARPQLIQSIGREMNLLQIDDVHCVLHARSDVIDSQRRKIIPHDFGERNAFANDFKHIANWNPSSANARFSKMDLRVNRDSALHCTTCQT
jgi:hypothetical protein